MENHASFITICVSIPHQEYIHIWYVPSTLLRGVSQFIQRRGMGSVGNKQLHLHSLTSLCRHMEGRVPSVLSGRGQSKISHVTVMWTFQLGKFSYKLYHVTPIWHYFSHWWKKRSSLQLKVMWLSCDIYMYRYPEVLNWSGTIMNNYVKITGVIRAITVQLWKIFLLPRLHNSDNLGTV